MGVADGIVDGDHSMTSDVYVRRLLGLEIGLEIRK